jgi:rhamnosyltransferase
MEEINIYAIVVTYNPNLNLLDEEYQSLNNQVDKIIYIDNGSRNQNDIRSWVKNKKRTEICYLNSNLGIATGQNIGIKIAIENNAKHVILFDQDSVLDNCFVMELYNTEIKCLNAGIKVGVIGPIYRSYKGEYYPILSFKDNKIVSISTNSFDEYTIVSHNIASGSLIRVDVLNEVGLMDESYFLDLVDFEWSFRLSKFGYKTIITKKATMKHQMGDKQIKIFGRIIGIYSPFRRYFTCRNCLLLSKKKYVPKKFSIRLIKLAIGKFIIGSLYGPHRIKQIHYCMKGFSDGLKNISGKITIKQ